jgi:hypothetical protein
MQFLRPKLPKCMRAGFESQSGKLRLFVILLALPTCCGSIEIG